MPAPDAPPPAGPPASRAVAVLGAGSWGTALACAAARQQPTLLWARDADLVRAMRTTRRNARYLPDIALPPDLDCTDDLEVVFASLGPATDGLPPLLILGTPVAGLEAILQRIAQAAPRHGLHELAIVWTCKGFHAEDARLPHEIAAATVGQVPGMLTGVLSGPSFAREVARGLPVALTVASTAPRLQQAATQALHGGAMRIYSSQDVVGVEVGGALKNVMAIACGIGDGLQLGTNARAALITRGLAEMSRLGQALGAQADTFAGLTGLGDLVLTATGDLSRNRKVGLCLGQGQALADILADGMTAEGVRCARAARQRARALDIELPITEAVCAVLFDGLPAADAVTALLARDPRPEE